MREVKVSPWVSSLLAYAHQSSVHPNPVQDEIIFLKKGLERRNQTSAVYSTTVFLNHDIVELLICDEVHAS